MTETTSPKKSNSNKRSRRDLRASLKLGDIRETLQVKIESRLETLECTNHDDPLFGEEKENEILDEEYNYESDVSMNATEVSHSAKKPKKRSRSSKTAAKKKIAKTGSSRKNEKKSTKDISRSKQTGEKHQRYPLVGVLLDEFSLGTMKPINHVTATALPSRYPPRHLCAVTGALANYREKKTGLHYCNRKAAETLLEHPPSWIRSNNSTPYFDAMRTIRDSLSEKQHPTATSKAHSLKTE